MYNHCCECVTITAIICVTIILLSLIAWGFFKTYCKQRKEQEERATDKERADRDESVRRKVYNDLMEKLLEYKKEESGKKPATEASVSDYENLLKSFLEEWKKK